jgi:hypothetical protein
MATVKMQAVILLYLVAWVAFYSSHGAGRKEYTCTIAKATTCGGEQ